MYPDPKRKKVIIIIGPTAVGKTRLSIELARRIGGEIISADSRYLYRGMDIGTAKPSKSELAKVKHHMIDIADPGETWSLAQYLEKTKEILNTVIAHNHIPIIVGGTGQYYRALTQGWSVPELEPDYSLREELSKWGLELGAFELHRKLAILDPEAAGFIQPQNVRRTIRALEVILITGEKFSAQREKGEPEYIFWIVGLSRERQELYRLVDERIEAMFREGLVEEVKRLKEKGYGANIPTMSAIGYYELLQYLDGEISLEEAKVLMRRNTRQFIRRQANWFKPSDPSIHWYSMTPDPLERIHSDLLNNFLIIEKSS